MNSAHTPTVHPAWRTPATTARHPRRPASEQQRHATESIRKHARRHRDQHLGEAGRSPDQRHPGHGHARLRRPEHDEDLGHAREGEQSRRRRSSLAGARAARSRRIAAPLHGGHRLDVPAARRPAAAMTSTPGMRRRQEHVLQFRLRREQAERQQRPDDGPGVIHRTVKTESPPALLGVGRCRRSMHRVAPCASPCRPGRESAAPARLPSPWPVRPAAGLAFDSA